MDAKQQRRDQLARRAREALSEWFAATDPHISDLARRRYRRTLKAIDRLEAS